MGAPETRFSPAELDRLLKGIANGRSLGPLRRQFFGIAAGAPRFGQYPGIELLAPEASPEQMGHLQQAALLLAGRFQADIENAADRPKRLKALRSHLRGRGLKGFIQPMNDGYRSEYVPCNARRLAWLTGFTGSAGVAIILQDQAAIWSDGRYTLQLRQQVDDKLFSLHHLTAEPPSDWLKHRLKAGDRIGFDPWLHTTGEAAELRRACERATARLVALIQNPIDAIWADRPAKPLGPVVAHDIAYAGEDSGAKRKRLAQALNEQGVAAAVLTAPESVAWLLNIRGADVPHTPLALARAILYGHGGVDLFLDRRKLKPPVVRHLGPAVRLHDEENFAAKIKALGTAKGAIQIDFSQAPAWVVRRLEAAGCRIIAAEDPCLLPKACKNPTELAGMRAAHLRDGAALCRFLSWLECNAAVGRLDELGAAAKLEAFRRENELIQDLSFPTISASGPHGAIVHYRVRPKTNRRLRSGELYLVDSGAQYLDGTTDVTRTLAIGEPSALMRACYTSVLRGHIALATARFPQGTSGQQLDSLARRPLWEKGLDYDHGTGHGVGSYLGVHEGPQRIAKTSSAVALRPGMIVSNEPGFYKTGAFGIRLENLVAVEEKPRPSLGFATLTLAPLARKLIDPGLLTETERAWLDAYHARVRERVSSVVDAETRDWLAQATRPLANVSRHSRKRAPSR
jgi:Xaa-Pro aminopeptidase